MKIRNLTVFALGAFAALTTFSCASAKAKAGESTLKELKIELVANPTTGYSWEYSLEQEGIVSVKENSTYLGEEGIVGAPSLFEYTVKALKDGQTKLTFVNRRSFEENSTIEQREYQILVKNGKIYAEGKIEGSWRLTDFTKNGDPQKICAVELGLQKNSEGLYVYGEGGVNVFNGTISLNANLASDLGGFAMTKMMGPKEDVEFEDLYIQLFNGNFTIIPFVKDGKETLAVTNLKNGLSAVYSYEGPVLVK